MSTITKSATLAGRTYLSPKELAERIPGMTIGNLAQMRFRGDGPKFMKPSPKLVVYDWVDAVAWLESTKRDGTAESE